MSSKIPPLDLAAEFREIAPELKPKLDAVIKSGRYILGPEVDAFEKNFTRFTGSKYALGVASGTDALLLGLMAFDVKPGDEIITTPFSFISTATTIARLGAKPVFVDIEPGTFNINPDLIQKKITKRTRGIIPVHLYGNPCRMDELMKVARKFKLFVIEDCAQSCGAEFKGKQTGTWGDIGAFSFYPTKTMGAMGDAGAVTVQDKKLYEKIKSLHLHGEDGIFHSYRHPLIGTNSRLDAVQAAVLNVKLKHLNKWNQKRRQLAGRYAKLISPSFSLPAETPGGRSVFHQYTIRTKKRDVLLKHLKSCGIAAGVYYPMPLYLQPCFRYLDLRKGSCPQAEKAAAEVISLPLYPQMAPRQQNTVISHINQAFPTV